MFIRHPYDNNFRSSNEDYDFMPFNSERQMMPPATGRPPTGVPAGRPPAGVTTGRPPAGAPTGRPPTGAPTGRPPMSQPPGRPPMAPPSAGGQLGGPSTPPPNFTPQKLSATSPQAKAVSPTSIRPCRFQFVFIWPTFGRPFWAWLTNVDRRSIAGFRWNGRRWVYFGMDLRRIEMFQCFGRNVFRESIDLSSNIKNASISPGNFNIDYPFVEGLQDEDVQSSINGSIVERINSMFNTAVLLPQQIDFNEIVSSYTLSLQRNGLISILFYLYTNTTDGNENTVYSSLIIDSNTGDEYDFEDLFNPNSNFRERLSQISLETARRENVPFTEEYVGVTDNQQFYLTENELVLYYQPGEFTPSSYGIFEISIPYSEIRDLFSQANPIANLSA